MTETDREALALANRRCESGHSLAHVRALKDLCRRGLVKNVRSDTGAWYELTPAGRMALASAPHPGA